MMKLTVSEMVCRSWLVVAALATIGCGGGSASTTTASTPTPSRQSSAPQPIEGDIERTTFAPALNVRLDSMVKRASGLFVQDQLMGTGAVATRTRTVLVRYSGWLANGKLFDSGEITVTLGTNKTIRAWEEGLLGMRAGGRRRLVVPPSMAYGARGSGNEIPPNSVLVFDMEMVSVM